MTKWFVRCAVGGSIIGSRMENDNGLPLTKAQAHRIAWRENVKHRNRAEREGRKTCFEFWADGVNMDDLQSSMRDTPTWQSVEAL